MVATVENIVIVGGGSAGWITAGLIAANVRKAGRSDITVTVIEAPDIPIIGVGEGTWPSMRQTLRTIGVDEADFMRTCHASYKQGSKFARWRKDDPADYYYHPFEPPMGDDTVDMAAFWLESGDAASFSESVSPQEYLCERHLAPKSLTSPPYGGFLNYGYHLDAGAFSVFLRDHCVNQLGVTHIADKVVGVVAADNGDITAVQTSTAGDIAGDLFIDCTGFRALLLGQHLGVGLVSQSDILFPDTALAVQVPYHDGAKVQSTTVATAQPAGWIWDVSLSSRRGVGHVYSSVYMDEDTATACLRRYLGMDEQQLAGLSVRKLAIGSGYRETFWKQNCVAAGLSAGFLEPLEASALMLIETSANMICASVLTGAGTMTDAADCFNRQLHGIWNNIIHFLKLHYCLSQREEAFWRDNRVAASMPDALIADLKTWQEKTPDCMNDTGSARVFPHTSYQYVLMGMKGRGTRCGTDLSHEAVSMARKHQEAMMRNRDRLEALLPDNRALLDTLANT